MYPHKFIIPNNSNTMYRNYNDYATYDINNGENRFFLGPLLVGGLAGTALGYGIANNNQMNNNNNCCCGNCHSGFIPYPVPVTYQNYPNNYPNNFSNFSNNNFY